MQIYQYKCKSINTNAILSIQMQIYKYKCNTSFIVYLHYSIPRFSFFRLGFSVSLGSLANIQASKYYLKVQLQSYFITWDKLTTSGHPENLGNLEKLGASGRANEPTKRQSYLLKWLPHLKVNKDRFS